MNRLSALVTKYPIAKGCILYSVLWPSSDLCRQISTTSPQDAKFSIDTQRLMRFSLFGSLWVAPTVFFWVKLTSKLIPGTTFGVAITKAVIEQFTYGPFSISTFYCGMSLLEGNSFNDACQEVKNKFLPTWKTGITFWPIVQTFNFALIPEKNRVIVVGIASFCWTTYLSFMKTIPS